MVMLYILVFIGATVWRILLDNFEICHLRRLAHTHQIQYWKSTDFIYLELRNYMPYSWINVSEPYLQTNPAALYQLV